MHRRGKYEKAAEIIKIFHSITNDWNDAGMLVRSISISCRRECRKIAD